MSGLENDCDSKNDSKVNPSDQAIPSRNEDIDIEDTQMKTWSDANADIEARIRALESMGINVRPKTDLREPTTISYEVQRAHFGDDYPTPFIQLDPNDWQRGTCGWGDAVRTVVEISMCALSSALREKPQWWIKMNDPVIRGKWRAEALAQPAKRVEWKLTERMVDYVLDELEGYAKLMDKETGIQVGCYERVWKSDTLVPKQDSDGLIAGVAKLENVPADDQDWHPGSDGQVLDLVHPSLYPIVYGQTHAFNAEHNSTDVLKAPKKSEFASSKFAWIPSDFAIGQDGVARIMSPYINNLHPGLQASMYPIIERFVTLSIPMFERVLSDMRRPLTPIRIKTSSIFDNSCIKQVLGIGCIWDGYPPYPKSDDLYAPDHWEQDQWSAFYATCPKHLPEVLDKYTGGLDGIEKNITLAGTTIQIIVKLANIVLTPEKPDYPGGSWHVEGMENEGIVSTFIHYYDEHNVTQSRLAFRTAVNPPAYHQQDDDECMKILYDMKRDHGQVQGLGQIITANGRCIAFPNMYQHQVQPFKLKDDTKPGHRKILTLFLINPNKPIPSATTIAPQQREWMLALLQEVLIARLPAEIIELIVQQTRLPDRKQTELVRASIMQERSKMVKANTETAFGIEFNMWCVAFFASFGSITD